MSEQRTRRELDVTGKLCPWPVMLTMKELGQMAAGEVLEVLTDNPPSVVNIPGAAKDEGHEVLGTETAGPGVHRIILKVKK